ncbi:MAG TPA: jacalin-like lectin [Panacibacter sp.]|nr:jacalin-like lectin [Panacibacter sp.]
MKTTNLIISFFSVVVFCSCKKQQEQPIKLTETESIQSANTSNLITWDQLPDKFKNAIHIQNPEESQSALRYPFSASNIKTTYGPYGGLTGTSFSIIPPSYGEIVAVGIGSTNGSTISSLWVWYSSNGTIFQYEIGAPLAVGSYFNFHPFETDEYIKEVSGRSSSFLNSLTITTNKTSFSGLMDGTNPGTPFAATVPIGNWIFGFQGLSDIAKIIQINFDVYCKQWQLLPGGSGRDIAVSLDGTAYMTNTTGKIYRMAVSGTPSWIQLPGSDGKSIAANANRVCMVNTAGKIYELSGSTWKQLPGSDAADITINSDGKIWMVNTAGKIYRYNDAVSTWDIMAGSSAARIAAGSNMVWMINTVGKIYKWNGVSWTLMTGSSGKDIAVGNDGSVWLTNVAGIIYHYTGSSWDELCGSYGSTIAANNKKVQLINSSGNIYKLTY